MRGNWEFPSHKFGKTQQPAQKPENEELKADPVSLPAREVKYDSYDVNKVMKELALLRKEVGDYKNAISKSNDMSFKTEVIEFFSFIMDSIEKVSGGKFPSKEKIISEFRGRYIK